jgi:ABC-type Fe3+ transport system substrate-binding protein
MTLDRRTMLGLTLAAPLLGGGSRASAQSLDDLYDRAQGEALTLYTGGAAANSAGLVAAFSARYPGIAVSVNGDYSNVTDRKIDRQLRTGRIDADIASLQTVQDFVRWKRAGALLPFTFPGFERIDAEYKDPGGAFVATNLNPLVYAYNPALVPAAATPKSALDFLHPRFRGKVITAYPHDDDASLYLFSTIVDKYGWSWMERYMANRPTFIQGHLGVAQRIAAGHSALTFDLPVRSGLDYFKKVGKPVELYFSPVERTPVFFNTVGILRGAPHPNAAKLFVAWYLSRDEQQRLHNFSPRPDVAPPPGFRPLSSYRLADRYREFLVRPQIDALRRRFLAYTGPVVNKSA